MTIASFNHGGCSRTQCWLSIGRLVLLVSSLYFTANTVYGLASAESALYIMNNFGTELNWVHYFSFSLVMVVLLSGVVGAITRNATCLKVFAYGFICFALLMALFTLGLYSKTDIKELDINLSLKLAQKDYDWNKPGANYETVLWDNYQKEFECCGLKGRSDWDAFKPFNYGEGMLPRSCCKPSYSGRCHYLVAFEDGCESQFREMANWSIKWLSIRVILYLALAILAFVLARPNYSAVPNFNPFAGLTQKTKSRSSQMSPA